MTDSIYAPGTTIKKENVNSPAHYQNKGIETIDYIEAVLDPKEQIGFCIGNVLKYVSRCRNKGGLEDLQKAEWYLKRAISIWGNHESK